MSYKNLEAFEQLYRISKIINNKKLIHYFLKKIIVSAVLTNTENKVL
jgi:hypothetical protein